VRLLLNAAVLALLSLVLATGCGRTESDKPARRIPVVAKKYTFEPREIHLKQGEEVVLEVTSADVQHGFSVPSLGISEPIQKGKVAEIRLTPHERGEYRVECDIICGARHDEMMGKIIVE
jgi:cytochrome c oxidase subunit II